jgi:hypothetical protein
LVGQIDLQPVAFADARDPDARDFGQAGERFGGRCLGGPRFV